MNEKHELLPFAVAVFLSLNKIKERRHLLVWQIHSVILLSWQIHVDEDRTFFNISHGRMFDELAEISIYHHQSVCFSKGHYAFITLENWQLWVGCACETPLFKIPLHWILIFEIRKKKRSADIFFFLPFFFANLNNHFKFVIMEGNILMQTHDWSPCRERLRRRLLCRRAEAGPLYFYCQFRGNWEKRRRKSSVMRTIIRIDSNSFFYKTKQLIIIFSTT